MDWSRNLVAAADETKFAVVIGGLEVVFVPLDELPVLVPAQPVAKRRKMAIQRDAPKRIIESSTSVSY